jgi:LysM repeat protein
VLPDGTIMHTVAAGESFYSIAANYGLTLEDFYVVSTLTENDVLQAGQEVIVGHRPQPKEIGGSTDSPESAATDEPEATTMPTATFTAVPPQPSPTTAVAEASVQAGAAPQEAQEAVEGQDSVLYTWLPIFLGLTGVLLLGTALIVFVRRK